MSYRILGIFISVFLMIFSPALSGIIFDNVSEKSEQVLDKSNLESKEISVYMHSNGICDTMDLEDYICGVVMAEVPSNFEPEALKAMAVAIRSYTLRRIMNTDKDISHYSADVCDDYTHCQGYISYEQATEKWGELLVEESYEKIKKAVKDTKGEVLYYKGNIADTVYHSSSNGSTESAENVWGFEIPYLVSVPTYESCKTTFLQYDAEDFSSCLSASNVECSFEREASEWISDIKKNDSGRVESVNICDTVISGRRMREIFGLRSTCFDIDYSDGFFTFSVEGYGHGVGMSQQGCEAMAQEGYDYTEILAHYYSGTELDLY